MFSSIQDTDVARACGKLDLKAEAPTLISNIAQLLRKYCKDVDK